MAKVNKLQEKRQKSSEGNAGLSNIHTLRLLPFFVLLWCITVVLTAVRQRFFSTLRIAHNAPSLPAAANSGKEPTKILYIVTSMAEFDNGQRNTLPGRDRFKETLIPVVTEALESMLAFGFSVDFYLISHYTVSSGRQRLLKDALPSTVGRTPILATPS